MSTPESPSETQAATLAAALIERIGPLARAAADAKGGIAADRERFADTGEADALIDTVIERVDELEADCRRLMRILTGFEAAAAPLAEAEPGSGPSGSAAAVEAPTPAPATEAAPAVEPAPAGDPAPAAEPTPAEEAAGIVSFPGAAAGPPAAEPGPPAGEPVALEPPAEAPPAEGSGPGEGAPEGAGEPPAEAPAQAEGGVDADPGEPVHVSEGVRLLATQMSVAGASTADIARRLHNDFGVEDADRLIAHLFGSSARAPG